MSTDGQSPPPQAHPWFYLGVLICAYIGIYLCRKNLSVAVPILQEEWMLSKEQIGLVGSISTVAYAVGKVSLGPVVDRLGGRRALVSSMLLVALFGAMGAFVPGLAALTVVYSANRFAGSASWGSMVKIVPEWFARTRWPLAFAVLSLSFVFGGALAVAFAGLVAQFSHDNWRLILGVPSLVLAGLALGTWWLLRRSLGGAQPVTHGHSASKPEARFAWRQIPELFRIRQLYVICALSFTLTFLRETFNFWTVDYLKTAGQGELSTAAAAMLSTPFDVCGVLGILALGGLYGRLANARRRWVLFWMLLALGLLLVALPWVAPYGVAALAAVIGLVGFLAYGPYSLLAGVLAVEVRGRGYAATVAGLVDGTGYAAGVLSGSFFGYLLSRGGYALGFQSMAGLMLLSAVASLFLYSSPKTRSRDASPTS